jgi:hypothetical protein
VLEYTCIDAVCIIGTNIEWMYMYSTLLHTTLNQVTAQYSYDVIQIPFYKIHVVVQTPSHTAKHCQ